MCYNLTIEKEKGKGLMTVIQIQSYNADLNILNYFKSLLTVITVTRKNIDS